MDFIEEDMDMPPACHRCREVPVTLSLSSPCSGYNSRSPGHQGSLGPSPGSPFYMSTKGETHWTKVLHVSDEDKTLVVDHGQISIQFVCNCPKHRKHGKKKNQSVADINPDTNVFTNLYRRFCRWIDTKRKSKNSQKTQSKRNSQAPLFLSDLPPRSPSAASSLCTESPDWMACQSPLTSETSEYSSFTLASSWSSFTVISTPSISDCHGFFKQPSDELVDSFPTDDCGRLQAKHNLLRKLLASNGHLNHLEQRSFSSDTIRKVSHAVARRCSWPTLTNPDSIQIEPISLLEHSWWLDSGDTVMWKSSSIHYGEKRDPLTEFTIPFADIELMECVRHGRSRRIQKGRWHGDVTIYTFSDMSPDEERCFRKQVSGLSKLRHENVVLYMGACLEYPHFAIVASSNGSSSLYCQVHTRDERLEPHRILDIARQVALAVEYLHAKTMVVGCLKSHNVFLESKVKLSMVDESFPVLCTDEPDTAFTSRGHLTYLAPELLRSLYVEDGWLKQSERPTTKTDAFAFGTLLYEMIACQFPLNDSRPDVIIWQVCNGKRSCLRHLVAKCALKRLIKWCWEQYSTERPDFEDINQSLQTNIAMNRRHSTSSPDIPLDRREIKYC